MKSLYVGNSKLQQKIRLALSIILGALIAPMTAALLGLLATAIAAYVIGGSDFVTLVMRPHEKTSYDWIVVTAGIVFIAIGGVLGVYFWRYLLKKTGLISLDYIDKLYDRCDS